MNYTMLLSRWSRAACIAVALGIGLGLAGCTSSTGPVLPKGELTAEQLEKIKKEDRAIEQEESQGSVRN
ncbi:MAG: hypothetical protein ACKOAU_15750 [Pirellula sp.]